MQNAITTTNRPLSAIEKENQEKALACQDRAVLILDLSGSMDGPMQNKSRLAAMKEAVYYLTSASNPDICSFAVLGFSNKVYHICPQTIDFLSIQNQLMNLQSISGTHYLPALRASLELDITRVIFISDGEPADMHGVEAEEIIQEFIARGIRIDTIGVCCGTNLVLKDLSDRTGGLYSSVESDPAQFISSLAALETEALGLLDYMPEDTTIKL